MVLKSAVLPVWGSLGSKRDTYSWLLVWGPAWASVRVSHPKISRAKPVSKRPFVVISFDILIVGVLSCEEEAIF